MPNLLFYKYFILFIVSYDALNEPPHVHISVTKSQRATKVKLWLEELKFQTTGNLSTKEQNEILKVVAKYQKELIRNFNKARNGRKVKPIIVK